MRIFLRPGMATYGGLVLLVGGNGALYLPDAIRRLALGERVIIIRVSSGCWSRHSNTASFIVSPRWRPAWIAARIS